MHKLITLQRVIRCTKLVCTAWHRELLNFTGLMDTSMFCPQGRVANLPVSNVQDKFIGYGGLVVSVQLPT